MRRVVGVLIVLALLLVTYGGVSAQCPTLGVQITNLLSLNWGALDWSRVDCS